MCLGWTPLFLNGSLGSRIWRRRVLVGGGGGASEEEIKAALWSLKPFKALSPDGLHAGFFQKFWYIVGNSVIEEVQNIFEDRRVLEALNSTHIALIPKI